MEYYSTIKKNEITLFAGTRMDLESHTEWISQMEKEKCHMTSLICEIYKEMIELNLQNRKRITDLKNKLMVAEGKEVEKG